MKIGRNLLCLIIALVSSAEAHGHGRPNLCERIATDRDLFAKSDPNFDNDPASLAVFADKLQDGGISYGTFLSLRLNALRAKELGDFETSKKLRAAADKVLEENAASWLHAGITRTLRGNKKSEALVDLRRNELEDGFGFESPDAKISERVIFGEDGRIRGLRFQTHASFLAFFKKGGLETFKVSGMDALEVGVDGASAAQLKKGHEIIEGLAQENRLKSLTFTGSLRFGIAAYRIRSDILNWLSDSTILHESVIHLGFRNLQLAALRESVDTDSLLPQALAKFTKLQALNFDQSHVDSIVFKAIKTLPELKKLNINATIYDFNSLEIARELTQLRKLTFIEIGDEHILRELSQYFPGSKFPNLEHLGVHGGPYYRDHHEIWLKLPKSRFPRLKELNLGGIYSEDNLETLLKLRPELEVTIYRQPTKEFWEHTGWAPETTKERLKALDDLAKKYRLRIIR